MPVVTTTDHLKLHYEDAGTGLPVLCLPGLTRNGSDFDYVAPFIAELGCRMIRLDSRGRGQSDWADPKTYQIDVEMRDVLTLLDHLGLEKVAILGTSRGGLIAMLMGAMAKDRLIGVCLNDIGPVIEAEGLAAISGYIGRNPSQKDFAEAARVRAQFYPEFENVPLSRWQEEVTRHFIQTPEGLKINYDPNLAQVFNPDSAQPAPNLWPLFDALDGLPLTLIHGANSNLLSVDTADEMARRRPDMIRAEVPGRGHVPFLDEPESVAALTKWIGEMR